MIRDRRKDPQPPYKSTLKKRHHKSSDVSGLYGHIPPIPPISHYQSSNIPFEKGFLPNSGKIIDHTSIQSSALSYSQPINYIPKHIINPSHAIALPSVVNPLSSVVNPLPPAVDPSPSAVNPISSVDNPSPSAVNPSPSAVNPISSVDNPIPSVDNPIPSVDNPISSVDNPISSVVNRSPSVVNLSPSVNDSSEDDEPNCGILLLNYHIIGGKGWQRIFGYNRGTDIQPLCMMRRGAVYGISLTHSGIGVILSSLLYICCNILNSNIPDREDPCVMGIIQIDGTINKPVTFTIMPEEELILLDEVKVSWHVPIKYNDTVDLWLQRGDCISVYADNLSGANIELYIEY